MPETLAALFLAHVLADYVFQPGWMVEEKSRPETLFLHFLAVTLTAMVTTGQVASPAIYALALTHIVIDTIKVRFFSDTILPHLADQALHLGTLVVTALLVPDLFQTGAYASLTWLPKAMLITAGAIYATRAGGFAVGKLMERFGPNPIGESLDKGGFWIGILERGLIFLLLIGQMPGGIGFLVAAKSVLRFEAAQEGKKAEWVIIGTLASFGWAIAVTLAVLFIAAQLPPLGISALNDQITPKGDTHMFGIPGKQAVTITPAAAKQIAKLMEKDGSMGLRIGVKKGGCAGMEYTMDYVSEIDPLDELVEQDGARVMIAPMAQMFLFGTEIDYQVSLLESGFKFKNPNVVDECGCGESIKFDESLASK